MSIFSDLARQTLPVVQAAAVGYAGSKGLNLEALSPEARRSQSTPFNGGAPSAPAPAASTFQAPSWQTYGKPIAIVGAVLVVAYLVLRK